MSLKTILVEDNESMREQLISALHSAEAADFIAVAESAEDAASVLETHQADWQLAIVDLALKAGSGLTVLRACKHRPAHQHVVVLTHFATPAIRQRCLTLRADAVFDKSTEMDEFVDYCKSLQPG